MNALATLNHPDQPVTMSSRDIAELTGKQHTNVIRDIRKMLDDLEIAELKFESSYKDTTGRTLTMFNLPRRETMILVGRRAPKARPPSVRLQRSAACPHHRPLGGAGGRRCA